MDRPEFKVGRFINHSCVNFNIVAKKIIIDGDFRVIFVAVRKIYSGEQLFWDYGDERSDVRRDNPWMKT